MRNPGANAFDRGYLCAEYLRQCRTQISTRGLQAYLASYGEAVSLRTCQRYMLRLERFVRVRAAA